MNTNVLTNVLDPSRNTNRLLVFRLGADGTISQQRLLNKRVLAPPAFREAKSELSTATHFTT